MSTFRPILPTVFSATLACVTVLAPAAPALAETAEVLLVASGEQAGDSFGLAAAPAGDVNGDGYADIVVGAWQNDAGGAINSGSAYLYLGGPGADGVPDLVLPGDAEYSNLGQSVGCAGDLNGDGFDDFFVSQRDSASTLGQLKVYYGGPGLDGIADLVLTGEATGDQFGTRASAGDINGDGYDDLVVAAANSGAGGFSSGRVYVFFGGPSVDTVVDLTYTGIPGENVGTVVETAADLNGDGHADLLVGAGGYDEGFETNIGRVHVFHGGPALDAIPDLTIEGEAANNLFGDAAAPAGDFNGDGYDDLVVGASGYGSGAGRVYVFHGGPGMDDVADFVLTGPAGLRYGEAIAGGSDLNEDGFGDFVLGVSEADNDRGAVLVFHGGAIADTVADLTLLGTAEGDGFGSAVGIAGDVDGDGFDDLVVGEPYNDAAALNAGRAYVFSTYLYHLETPNGGETWASGLPAVVRWEGRDLADIDLSLDGGLSWFRLASGAGGLLSNEHALLAPATASEFAVMRITVAGEAPNASNSITSAAPFRIDPPARPVAYALQWSPRGGAANDGLGYAVAAAGDVNGDGLADVIIGATQGEALGAAYVCFGGTDCSVPDLTLTGGTSDLFGGAVGTAGDVNGDGFDDLIVGAEVPSEESVGRVFVFHGGPAADAIADLVITGEAIEDQFGISVGTAGDVNGDGFDDIIVGAAFNDVGGVDAGRAYVFFGGPGMDTVADLVFTGEAAGDRLGNAVGTAGDVNRDGFDDVIVGAYLNDAGGATAGRAYVFHGGPAANATPNLILTGEAPGDLFGESVATAGDVNGDGFDDVIVGASRNDSGGTDAGRTYVFFGGLASDVVADLVLTGESVMSFFGTSVASAGDVNADGFDDLIVGAFGYSVTGPNAGKAYLYHGGPPYDDVPDWSMVGGADFDYYAQAVAGVGDTNGDGFDDFVVGAIGVDTGGNGAGAAYVYDSNRYQVLSPQGAALWNVGATQSLTWAGAEPADVWLSVDGGDSYSLLRSNRGGSSTNGLTFTVPHQPTRFAKIRVTPHDGLVSGSAESDSLFTIEASITLLNLKAQPVDGGVLLSWETNPGPADLAGYRLERSPSREDRWTVLTAQTRETEYLDSSGVAGMRYRLTGINGLGEELFLGETALTPRATLAAWPLPYRGGNLNLSFAATGGPGGGVGRAEVAVYDVRGRLVRTVTRGLFEAGYHTLTWDGRDDAGSAVSRGVYFLRVVSAEEVAHMKLVVTR